MAEESVGRVVVTVLSGQNLAPRDPTGTSDPYCILGLWMNGNWVDKKTNIKSTYIKQNLNPVWKDAKLSVPLFMKQEICLQVWDHDSFDPDDFMGEVFFDVEYLRKELPDITEKCSLSRHPKLKPHASKTKKEEKKYGKDPVTGNVEVKIDWEPNMKCPHILKWKM
eukprot:TRINITY_DN16593_c0_g1_i1.p1 TRINITY_DN16593_c0_g1~~TRINITY_DN16593_c0_g1_i1.p1  ORF type:complete len:166 (-),score=32.02 TRINITY_DN16593_c0_g1_i1:62-559(-)